MLIPPNFTSPRKKRKKPGHPWARVFWHKKGDPASKSTERNEGPEDKPKLEIW